jgi:hypothetical protein
VTGRLPSRLSLRAGLLRRLSLPIRQQSNMLAVSHPDLIQPTYLRNSLPSIAQGSGWRSRPPTRGVRMLLRLMRRSTPAGQLGQEGAYITGPDNYGTHTCAVPMAPVAEVPLRGMPRPNCLLAPGGTHQMPCP